MSELPNIAQKKSYKVGIEEGKKYAWCACGLSNTQPFCDGSHKGGSFAPVVFTADATKDAYLCGCKHSNTKPFCDGTHKTLL